MSIFIAALFLGAPQVQQAADYAPGMRKASLEEATSFMVEAFGQLDRDGSGYLDPREASALEPRDLHRERTLPPAPAAGERDAGAETKWMGKLDSNGDGKVSPEEYLSYMTPWILLSGVPTAWKPKG